MNRLSNIGTPLDKKESRWFNQNRQRAIFLRDLPYHFRDTHLRALVVSLLDGNEAAVDLCRVKYSSRNGKTLQIGIAMLRNEKDVQNVLRCLKKSPRHCGRDIRACEFLHTNVVQPSNDGTLHFTFTTHLVDPLITEEIIRTHLENIHGPLQTICIRGHFDTKHGQEGFGFCSFQESSHNNRLVTLGSISISHVNYSFNSANPVDTGDSEESRESGLLYECTPSILPSTEDSRSIVSKKSSSQEYSCNTTIASMSSTTTQQSMGPATPPMLHSCLPRYIPPPLPIVNMNMNLGIPFSPMVSPVAPSMVMPMRRPMTKFVLMEVPIDDPSIPYLEEFNPMAPALRSHSMILPAGSCHAPQAYHLNNGSPRGVTHMFPGEYFVPPTSYHQPMYQYGNQFVNSCMSSTSSISSGGSEPIVDYTHRKEVC